MITECPHCYFGVVPTSSGECPGCRRNFEDPPQLPGTTAITLTDKIQLPPYCVRCDQPAKRTVRIHEQSAKASQFPDVVSASTGLLPFWLRIPAKFGLLWKNLLFVRIEVPLCSREDEFHDVKPLQVDFPNRSLRLAVCHAFRARIEGDERS